MSLDDALRTLLYEFMELGISPDVWTRWSIDRVEEYWNERLRRDEELADSIARHRRAAAAANVAPRIYYSIRVR